MPLKTLFLRKNPVRDLSPLGECPIEMLICESPNVTDLAPLQSLPLKNLVINLANVKPDKGVDVLRKIKTLDRINSSPAAAFLRTHGAT